MEAEVAKRLLDALGAARLIAEFTAGMDFSGFAANVVIRSAVERQFEIIGEALRQAEAGDGAIATEIPDLRRIVGLRNRLIHGYDTVDDELVWDIVQTKIGPLVATLTQRLEQAGYPSG